MENINLATLLMTAMVLGISNGLSPGPSLTLVISHTLHHDYKSGIKVACGPIIFAVVIVPICILVSFKIDTYKTAMGLISIVGALFIAYLGIKQLSFKKMQLNEPTLKLKSFTDGALANFSSPYPYIFWFTVGAPLIARAEGSSLISAIGFVVIYYISLIGSKILVALIVEKFRTFLDKGYTYVMHILAITLLIFACFIFKDGITLLWHQ
jgi:threonine/homoserine/homoserine lactone efflux protein